MTEQPLNVHQICPTTQQPACECMPQDMNAADAVPLVANLVVKTKSTSDNSLAQLGANLDNGITGVAVVSTTNWYTYKTDALSNYVKDAASKTTLNIQLAGYSSTYGTVAHTAQTSEMNADIATGKAGRYLTVTSGHGLKDANGNALADLTTATAAKEVTFTNERSALISTVSVVTTKKLMLTFDKELSSTEANTAANYYVYLESAPSATVAANTATIQTDKKMVLVEFATALTSGGAYKLVHQNLKDSLGYTVVKNDGVVNTSITPKSFTATAAGPKAVSATFNDTDNNGKDSGDIITVTFDQPVSLVSGQTIAAADFGIAGSTDAWYNSTGPVDGFGTGATFTVTGSTLVITLGSSPATTVGLFTANSNAGSPVLTSTMAVLAKIQGEGAATVVSTDIVGVLNTNKTCVAAPDTTGPKVSTAVFTDSNSNAKVDSGDKLVLTFDKKVTLVANGIIAADLKATSDAATFLTSNWTLGTIDGTTGNGSSAATGSNGNEVTVTLGTDANLSGVASGSYFNAGLKVQIKNGGMSTAANLTNLHGITATGGSSEAIAAAAAVTPTVTGDDSVGAKITAAKFIDVTGDGLSTNDKVQITFDKKVTINGTVNQSVFTGFGTSAAGTLAATADPTIALFTMTTLGGGFVPGTSAINVSASAPSNGVKTMSGKSAIPAASDVTVTVSTATVATIGTENYTSLVAANAAAVAGNTITLTADESLNTDMTLIADVKLVVNTGVTLTLNGKLSATGNASPATITNKGTIKIADTVGGIAFITAANAKLTMDAGSKIVDATGTTLVEASGASVEFIGTTANAGIALAATDSTNKLTVANAATTINLTAANSVLKVPSGSILDIAVATSLDTAASVTGDGLRVEGKLNMANGIALTMSASAATEKITLAKEGGILTGNAVTTYTAGGTSDTTFTTLASKAATLTGAAAGVTVAGSTTGATDVTLNIPASSTGTVAASSTFTFGDKATLPTQAHLRLQVHLQPLALQICQ